MTSCSLCGVLFFFFCFQQTHPSSPPVSFACVFSVSISEFVLNFSVPLMFLVPLPRPHYLLRRSLLSFSLCLPSDLADNLDDFTFQEQLLTPRLATAGMGGAPSPAAPLPRSGLVPVLPATLALLPLWRH